MTLLSIAIHPFHGFCLVRLAGDLAGDTREPWARTVDGDLLGSGRSRIVVDAARLGFCDLSGLRALMASQRRAEGMGGALRLIGVQGALARLIVVAQVVDQFPPYSGLAHASSWPRPP
ncbi:STAS domain-containing protein [Nonomuraea pusilla]|uniref:Anti-anti-sigma factor n=1 Tax=Nonomuraea pusilla TaxID=46177 RepID=A0A1H7LRN1_9ACTN|nr:STAS domain-containing protein [Nonomuraea pusilla]SEL01613.1 anti-anti-sigma factor [Nonomuraea pusilla]